MSSVERATRSPRPATKERPPWLEQLTAHGAVRVPEVAALFWVIKGLSTAMGESTSDYLVHRLDPVVAVLIGFVAFAVALLLQFSRRRYVTTSYWFAVVMVGVFGTMAADVLHVGLHVPYVASSVLYAGVLAAIFIAWQRTEHTLSFHEIDTTRREAFYWAAVVATFAMGTAVGDLTSVTLHLGYLGSMFLFAGLILVPAIAYRLGANAVLCFWTAYVLTRPLGASFADWIGKPRALGGVGFGEGPMALVLSAAIVVLVGYLAVTKRDVQARG